MSFRNRYKADLLSKGSWDEYLQYVDGEDSPLDFLLACENIAKYKLKRKDKEKKSRRKNIGILNRQAREMCDSLLP